MSLLLMRITARGLVCFCLKVSLGGISTQVRVCLLLSCRIRYLETFVSWTPSLKAVSKPLSTAD